jgi:peptidoglycan/LPS O-acetylase OafA/YrhL
VSSTEPAHRSAPDRIEILQAIRALAALSVLLFHAGHAANKYGGPMPIVGLTELGVIGVDLFFVLSGFIIMHVTVGRGISLQSYARSRFRRIFLPYWPVGLIMAVLVFGIFPQGWGAMRGWFVSLTLIPVGHPALNVAWTLQHEILFYALVAAGLYSGWWRSGLVLWCGLILFFAFSGIAAPMGLQPIDLEFIMGVAAWAAFRNGQRHVIGATSLVLLLCAASMLTFGLVIGIERSGPIAIAAIFAACLPWLVLAERSGKIGTPKSLRFVGDASYSIYLVHGAALLLLSGFWDGFSWFFILPVALIVGLASGIGYHLFVERPALALMPKREHTLSLSNIGNDIIQPRH